MAKYEQLTFGDLCSDLLSEQTLRGALSALQRGPIRFRRNHVIACEGDDADYVFLVVSGVVRSCKTFHNGERAVVAFYLPGALFGWGDEVHPLSIEAACDAMVMLIKRKGLATIAANNARLATFLRSVLINDVQRAQEHASMISMTARDRFVTFIRDWLKRSGASDSIHLPIGYQDIADHLGISIETLSRVITELERSGALARAPSRGVMTLKRLPAVGQNA
jgi:CRP/FNR family nitrogen fixation transcriptional regulator